MSESEIDDPIRAWAADRRLPQVTLIRWLSLAAFDRLAILNLAKGLRMRAGQFLTAFELLDEISVRENVDVASILARPELSRVIDSANSAPGKAHRLLELLRTIRFPRLKQMADRLAAQVAQLRLPANIHVVLPADLESDELRLELVFHGSLELNQSLDRIIDRRAALARLADTLGGSDEI